MDSASSVCIIINLDDMFLGSHVIVGRRPVVSGIPLHLCCCYELVQSILSQDVFVNACDVTWKTICRDVSPYNTMTAISTHINQFNVTKQNNWPIPSAVGKVYKRAMVWCQWYSWTQACFSDEDSDAIGLRNPSDSCGRYSYITACQQ